MSVIDIESQGGAVASESELSNGVLIPRQVPGTALLGRYDSAGLNDDRYLIRRLDGQMILVSALFYMIVSKCDGVRTLDEVAAVVSEATGRRLPPSMLRWVIAERLGPMGVLSFDDDGAPLRPRADPLLALSGRCVVVPERAVQSIAKALAPLFRPVVVVGVLLATITFVVWLFAFEGASSSIAAVLASPSSLLSTLGLLAAFMLFHEFGHAAACHYGGAKPGSIGAGIYVFFPAFYTNVTDAYRLDRSGRLRTDLGGIYFNAISIVAAAALYVTVGSPIAVVLIVLTLLEILQQLVPIVRLDGYYVLSDLAGVPDLFARIRPILRSVLHPRERRSSSGDLRRGARTIVIAWVAIVVPVLAVSTVFLLLRAPQFVARSSEQIHDYWNLTMSSTGSGEFQTAALGAVSLLIVLLPLVGLVLFTGRLAVRGVQVAHRVTVQRHTATPAHTIEGKEEAMYQLPTKADSATSFGLPMSSSAAAFTEETMIRARNRAPEDGWRRLLFHMTGGFVNTGPGRAELERRELIARARSPITGSRRVVVLCRKGGAGKTSTTVMLGHTLASHRGDRVIALDANPDAGSLAQRVRRETTQTVTSMLADRALLDRYADIRAYTSQAPTRLEVLASDDDPRLTEGLGEDDYRSAISILDRHYNLILIDTGTGILDPAIQGVLAEADQIVVTMPPALDGARVAASTLDWLVQHGHGQLVSTAIAVINAVQRKDLVELDRVEAHFAERCASVVRIPWDPALAAGGTTLMEDLHPQTRLAYLKLAAAVADEFRTTSPRE